MLSRATAAMISTALLAASSALAARDHKSKPPDDPHRIQFALDRFTFGARPGDVDRVRAIGLDRWFEQQLHPESIDDRVADAKVADLLTLKMTPRQIAERFPTPQIVRAVVDGKISMPSDPQRRAIYEVAVERYQRKKDQQGNTLTADPQLTHNKQSAASAASAPLNSRTLAPRITPEDRAAGRAAAATFLSLAPSQRFQQVLRMPDGERLALFRALTPDERQEVFSSLAPEQRETILALTTNPAAVPTTELLQAKLLRETYSERQLQEVMTDFWLNHFNVYIGKQQERYLLSSYERDVIRPHALGKFQDLLIATAKSPAMLVYLDNALSIGPDSKFAIYGPAASRPNFGGGRYRRFGRGGFGFPAPAPPRKQNAKRKLSGLNENYARELMELQTLGVDGGYTQQDVTQLARVLTGWSVSAARDGRDEFEFHPEMHEPGTKIVLGHKINGDGENEGIEMLKILAHHPSTAHFISKKLAMRFVSDDPPPALVDRMAHTFLKSDGDIREVLRTMFHSPELWAPQSYRAKVKTPLEFVVSSLRATAADVANAQSLTQVLDRMGMPLYGSQPPTGYSMDADAWVNSASLLNRLNFALALASGRMPGVTVDAQSLAAITATDAAAGHDDLASLETALLGGDISANTHYAIEKELDDPSLPERARNADLQTIAVPKPDIGGGGQHDGDDKEDPSGMEMPKAVRPQPRSVTIPMAAPSTRTSLALGLVLGSPEFQRR